MEIKNIVIETQQILEESNRLLYEKNKKYYMDVLDFMNLLFSDDAKILSKIKFKKITLNICVLKLYNEIIKTYKLNKPEFDVEKFDLNEIKELEEIKKIFFNIAYEIANNLLVKLDYKLKKKFNKEQNKTIFILVT